MLQAGRRRRRRTIRQAASLGRNEVPRATLKGTPRRFPCPVRAGRGLSSARPFTGLPAALNGEIERLLAQLQAVDVAEAAFQRLTDAFAVPDPRGLDRLMSGSPTARIRPVRSLVLHRLGTAGQMSAFGQWQALAVLRRSPAIGTASRASE